MLLRVSLAGVLALSVLAMGACGGDDGEDNDSGTTPDVGAGATPDPDAGATPDPVDPNVVSTAGLDVNPLTPEIDSTGPVSGDFVIAYTVTELGMPMVGYQFDIEWDGSNVEFVSVEHLENGGLTLCPQTEEIEPQRILGACAQPQLISTDYTGQVALLTFRCNATGDATLHLRYLEGSFGTKIETYTEEFQTSHSLALSDATVTCT